MTQLSDEKFTGIVEELPYPATLPNDASGFETIRVIENHNDDGRIHVQLSGSFDYAESWGSYLADVVRAIARDYPDDELGAIRSDGDVLKAMIYGFMHSFVTDGEAQRPEMTERELERYDHAGEAYQFGYFFAKMGHAICKELAASGKMPFAYAVDTMGVAFRLNMYEP